MGFSSLLAESTLLGLACDALQQALDLAVLLALAVGPFADHLLLGAHMRDQALNGLREVGHRSSGAAVVAAFLHGGAQALDGVLQVAAGAGGALAGIFLDGGGKPVFQIGVEAVL